MFNSRFTSFLPRRKFTWTDFGGIYTHILPVATPLIMSSLVTNSTGNCKLDHDCRRDSTLRLTRFGVGGVYWALGNSGA